MKSDQASVATKTGSCLQAHRYIFLSSYSVLSILKNECIIHLQSGFQSEALLLFLVSWYRAFSFVHYMYMQSSIFHMYVCIICTCTRLTSITSLLLSVSYVCILCICFTQFQLFNVTVPIFAISRGCGFASSPCQFTLNHNKTENSLGAHGII